MKLMERVTWRRADSSADKEAIFRMRYEAYRRDGNVEPNESGLLNDKSDEKTNAWLFGIYIDDDLAASIRLHIASSPDHYLPVLNVFPDIVMPRLKAGQFIIDGSRMTTRLDFARAYPFLPYLAIRTAFMADDYFGADLITAACRPEYEGAYRRMGGAILLAPQRPYPPMTRPTILMGLECREARRKLSSRFPFERSTPQERAALFNRSSNAEGDFYALYSAHRGQAAQSGMQRSITNVA